MTTQQPLPPGYEIFTQNHSRIVLPLTTREACQAVLLRVFTRIAPALGEVVSKTLCRVHGADRWSAEVNGCLGKTVRRKFDRDPSVLREDLFLITEVLIDKVNELLPFCCRHGYRGVHLESFVSEVYCVSVARNRLFHGGDLSGNEVYRCLLSLESVYSFENRPR